MNALIATEELHSVPNVKLRIPQPITKVESVIKPIRPSLISIKLRLPFRADESMLVTYTDQLGLFQSLQRRGTLHKNVAYDIDWVGDSMVVTNPANGDLVVECSLPETKPTTVPTSIH